MHSRPKSESYRNLKTHFPVESYIDTLMTLVDQGEKNAEMLT